jgi:dTDP-4-dehydrorhamnose reductase
MPNNTERLQVWGGLECTINRVQDRYFDQLQRTDHYRRGLSDLDAIAATGITALRYPVLWERCAPERDGEPDFSFAAAGLERLRDWGIRPIVGLVHHGSGPLHVSMLDDSFAEGLGKYAGQVAERFPWIDAWTPVNEPLTTARFCGLYGLWYPHRRDDLAFYRILMAECKGTVLAMQAVRKVNPAAQLIHTEDLGKTYSTPKLAYQAKHENHRRWLGLDFLCGRVIPGHPLWKRMIKAGIEEEALLWFSQNPCPPDVLGFNYYATSERFLDEGLSRYPRRTHGSNGRHKYADVELVRVHHNIPSGPAVLLEEAARRYRLPLALTEVHLHCSREEQMRWWQHLWTTATDLREKGVDIRAVTSWAMLGSVGWNKLLTRPGGLYESGAFAARKDSLHPTALVPMLRACAAGMPYHHPVLAERGWWEQDFRILYNKPELKEEPFNTVRFSTTRPLVILGKTGTLGQAFARVCAERGLKCLLLSRDELDLNAPAQMTSMLSKLKPWAVVNAAGYVRVDDAERDAGTCFSANAYGPGHLAEACAAAGIPMLSFSSDLVFDGNKKKPYTESDEPQPLNIYGHSKAALEKTILREHPESLIVRTSAFFGPWDEHNFVHHVTKTLEAGLPFEAMTDSVVSPTYVPHLVESCLELLLDGATGIRHICNSGAVSWYEWARMIARMAGYPEELIIGRTQAELNLPARRPSYCVMVTERGTALPTLNSAMRQYFHALQTIEATVSSEA